MTAGLKEARALHLAGHVDEAERRYRDILKQTPGDPDTLHLLGVARFQRQDYDEAIKFCRQAIAAKPGLFEAHRALCNALEVSGQLAEAEAVARRAIELLPDQASLHFALGSVLRAQARPADAADSFREAVRLNPSLIEARLNLGVSLHKARRHDDAVAAYRELIALQSDYVPAHFNLGVLMQELRRLDEAIAAYETAIRIKPDYVAAIHALGTARMENGDLESAEAAHRRVLQIEPDHVGSLCRVVSLLQVFGRHREGIALLRQALDRGLAPEIISRYLALAHIYDPEGGIATHHDQQRRAEKGKMAALDAGALSFGNSRDPERRLRIGYLSSDLHNHPVARNIELLLAHRDRARFELFAYADVAKPDAATARLKTFFDHWQEIEGWTDERVARQIRSDGVDVLLLLAGHFDRNRPFVASYRPAPVQISFHDPVSSGVREIDYLIADPVLVPKGGKEGFSERVLRLPNFYLHSPLVDAPRVTSAPALSAGYVTFGSFNSPTKINDRVLALWAEILKRVPNSRLVLKYLGYYKSPALQERIRREFSRQGIDGSRLEMGGTRETMGGHLANYSRVDIALDPFPFTGSTTTFEALWMGVPVVTLLGDWMVARWSASIMKTVGIDDLVARTDDEYVEKAVRLAGDLDRLNMLRMGLRGQVAGSAVCNGQAATRHFERLLQATWRKWRGNPEGAVTGKRDGVDRVRAFIAADRPDDARTAFEALTLPADAPVRAELCFELGSAYRNQRRSKDAAQWYARHLALRPGHAEAHFNHALVLQDQGRLNDAMAEYGRALQANPRLRAARENLALLLLMLGRPGDTIGLYRQGLKIAPGDADLHRLLVASTFYDPEWTDLARYREACRFDELFVKPRRVDRPRPATREDTKRRLRIGYVTSDFREHPVGRNMEPLLAHRNRGEFETVVYAEVAHPDAATERLKGLVDKWRLTPGLSDEQVAELVRNDAVDILVFLAGHLDRNRLLTAAYRPAPIQISLYDVTTSGTAAVDYLIADRVVCPRHPSEGFTERVIRLPMMYAYPVPNGSPPVAPPPCLKNGYVTFGSFNNPAKLNNITLVFWATVLNAVPGSRLALKFRQWFMTAELRMRITSAFMALGIDAARLEFLGAEDTLPHHLGRYNQIDIALDPFPFSGATTTFEALWMGVPVIGFSGSNMMSRCSASMLRILGLDGLVAETPESYVRIASELAQNQELLGRLRAELRSRVEKSSLCNGQLRMRQLERVYRAVWRRWCADRQ